jgi:hypothetical protein
MNAADLRLLIQGDIICCVDRFVPDGYWRHDDREDLKNMLCEIVVDRINEYEKGK